MKQHRSSPKLLIALYLLPSITILVMYRWIPVVWNFVISFQDWKPLGRSELVGFENYLKLVADPVFWQSLWNTLAYFFVGTPIAILTALLLAMFVNSPIRGRNAYRTIVFLPYVITPVAIGLIWTWMLNDRVGLVNFVLQGAGITEEPIAFLQSFSLALPTIIAITVWQVVGYFMLLILSGLQTVPKSLYEVAIIDGAGPLRRMVRITLPLIKSTLFLCFTIGMINSFAVFDIVYVTTGGGPGHATEFLITQIYKAAFEYNRMGYAAATTVVMFLLLWSLTLASNRLAGGEAGGARVYE